MVVMVVYVTIYWWGIGGGAHVYKLLTIRRGERGVGDYNYKRESGGRLSPFTASLACDSSGARARPSPPSPCPSSGGGGSQENHADKCVRGGGGGRGR